MASNSSGAASYDLETVCGVPLPLVTAPGVSLTAQLNQPYGLATAGGRLLVSDASNYVIRLIQPSLGQISTPYGNGYLSNPPNKPSVALTSSIGSPAGLAFDFSSGSVYFTDKWYQTIRKVYANGTMVTFAGIGSAGYSGDGGPATSAQVYNSKGVAVDKAGNVFIADSPNHLVRVVFASNGTIVRVAGSVNRSCGNDYDYNGDSGQTNACNYGYLGDGGLAVNALLNTPVGLSFDSLGNLYVGDSLNHAIRKISNPLSVGQSKITTVVGNGTAGFSGDGGLAKAALINKPWGIAHDADDNLYIAEIDGHIIRKVAASSGRITTFAGTPGVSGASGNGRVATLAKLNTPRYVTVDRQSGDVFISDSGNNAVRRVSASDRTIIQITRLYTVPTSNEELGDKFVLLFPKSAVADASGDVFVSDTNLNGLFRVRAKDQVMVRIAGSSNGNSATGDGGPALLASVGQPTTLAISSSGDLFFIDQINNIVRCIFAVNKTIVTVAGTGTRGNSRDGPALSTSMNLDTGLALDEDSGSLYISDTLNHVVRRLTFADGMLKIVAGVIDKLGFVGDGGPALNATLNFPTDLAFVPSSAPGGSRLCILDGQNFRIRVLWIANRTLATAAGNGTLAYPGEGVIATNSSLNPHALAANGAGDLFIGSPGRIQVLLASSLRLFTIAGSGQTGFAGDGGSALSGSLNQPNGLSFDYQTGSILVSDKGSRVIRRILPSRKPPPPPALLAPPLPRSSQKPRSYPNITLQQETMDGYADEPPEITDLKMAQKLYSKSAIMALTIFLGAVLFCGFAAAIALGVMSNISHAREKKIHRSHDDLKIDCLVGTVVEPEYMDERSLSLLIKRDWDALVQAGDTVVCFDEDFHCTKEQAREANDNGVPLKPKRIFKFLVSKIEWVDSYDENRTWSHRLVLKPPVTLTWSSYVRQLLFRKREEEEDDLTHDQVHRPWMGEATREGAAIWKLPETQLTMAGKAFEAGSISFINPRLLMFKYRGLLSIVILCLYIIGLAFVTILLEAQSCEKVCTTTFVQFVNVNDDKTCNSIFLSDPIPGFDLTVPGLRSEVNLGKCSLLHSQQCANDDWREVLQCYEDFSTWIIEYAPYLQINDWESFSPEVLRVFAIYKPAFNCSIDTTVAYNADCGLFSDTGNVCWVFEVSTSNSIQTGNGKCKNSKSKPRCAQSSIKAIVFESQAASDKALVTCEAETFSQVTLPTQTVMGADLTTAFNLSDGTLCGGDISKSNTGASCLTVRYTACQYVDGDAYFCLESTSSASNADFSFPGLLFGPSVLSDMTSGFFRDQTAHTCSPWPLELPLDTNGGSNFLSPLLQRLFVHLSSSFNSTKFSSFILNSTIRVAYDISDGQPRVDIGPSALGAFWARNLIYCCQDLCHPTASAVGEAFGYVDKFEMIFIMLAISTYLLLFREEARRLRLAVSHIIEFALGEKPEEKAAPAADGPSRTRSQLVPVGVGRSRPHSFSVMQSGRSRAGSAHSPGAMTRLTMARRGASCELSAEDKKRLAGMEDGINEMRDEIKVVMSQIEAVEKEQGEAKAVGDKEESQRLWEKELQLRQKEKQLRDELQEEKKAMWAERERALAAAGRLDSTDLVESSAHSGLKSTLRAHSSLAKRGSGVSISELSNSRLNRPNSSMLLKFSPSTAGSLGGSRVNRMHQIASHRNSQKIEFPNLEISNDAAEEEPEEKPAASPRLAQMRPASQGRTLPTIISISRLGTAPAPSGEESVSRYNPLASPHRWEQAGEDQGVRSGPNLVLDPELNCPPPGPEP